MLLLRAIPSLLALIVMLHSTALPLASAQTGETAEADVKAPAGTPARQAAGPSALTTLREQLSGYPYWTTFFGLVAALLTVGGGYLLYRASRPAASRSATDPFIQRLGPSFFFWLGMIYTFLLLLMAVVYNIYSSKTSPPVLIGGILPIAVPWFGALGAVTISLEGVFVWNMQWDHKFNYWHIGRPLFGAVLGIVAFFIFVLTISAAGTPPLFLDDSSAAIPKNLIVYYMVAFLVGYREETFRELIKRATDLILQTAKVSPEPSVTFRSAGNTLAEIAFPPTNATVAATPFIVEVQNSGTVPLIAPAVALSPNAGTPAATFGIAHDQVTGGGDLAPSQVRTLNVTFTPPQANNFSATLTVTATNLPTPKSIRVSGTGQ